MRFVNVETSEINYITVLQSGLEAFFLVVLEPIVGITRSKNVVGCIAPLWPSTLNLCYLFLRKPKEII